jgi:hypothetical protein
MIEQILTVTQSIAIICAVGIGSFLIGVLLTAWFIFHRIKQGKIKLVNGKITASDC